MTLVPAPVQEYVNRVDRTRALVIGISAGLTALWSVYRLFWLLYSATMLSSVGWSPVSLIVPFVLWGAIGVAAAFVAAAFLLRYAKQP
jgi:hypothetical protein